MTGTVAYSYPVEARGAKGFKVHVVVIHQDDVTRNPEIPVEFIGDLIKESIQLQTNDRVKIDLELHGRQWNQKWFLNAQAKNLQVIGVAEAPEQKAPPPPLPEDDLPF